LSYEWGHDTAELHVVVDDRLKEQNCFQITARPPFNLAKKFGKSVQTPRVDFRSFILLVAVDFTHPDFLRTFNHRRHTFADIAATAFYCFLKALEYTGEQQHLAEITARTDSYAEFLRITWPVSDDMPAIKREEKDARQKKQKQEKKKDRKRKQEQGTSTINSMIARNQISLPCAEPHDYIFEPDNRLLPRSASNEPGRRRLEMQAGASASSSADTFTTAVEDACEERSEASTLIEKPVAAITCSTKDNAYMEEVEPSTHDISDFRILPAHQSRPSSSSHSRATSDFRLCVSSSPTLSEYDELSQTSHRSKPSNGLLSPSNKANKCQSTSPGFAGLCEVDHFNMIAATKYTTKADIDITPVENALAAPFVPQLTKRSTTAPARALRGVDGKLSTTPVSTQSDMAEINGSSATSEGGSALAPTNSPSETSVADEAPRTHSTVFSGPSLSLDVSKVVRVRNRGKTCFHEKTRTFGSNLSFALTSPTKAQEQPSHLLRSGSESLQPTQSAGPMYGVYNGTAYETTTSHGSGGLLSSTLVKDHPVFSYARPNVMAACWLPGCQQPTNSCDVRTTSCPRCGPYSYVRYCSIQHLHADVRRHYTEDCTRRPNHLPYLDESTIYTMNSPPRVFISCSIPLSDSFERYRQALYHSCPPDARSDYFVFSDADNLVANEGSDAFITSPMLARYRGTGSVVATIRISSMDVRKAQFAAVLERLLSMGCAAGTIDATTCGVLFLFIKSDLRDRGMWDEVMIGRLCLAMQLEFGWRVPPRYS